MLWFITIIIKQVIVDKNDFATLINKFFPNCDKDFSNRIEKYKEFLQLKNKEFNLTRLDKESIVYEQYFFNSLIPYQNIINNDSLKILDIGSGSGIPGVALLCLFPNLQLTIIEPNKKKCVFLNELVKILNLKANILNTRAEEVEKKYINYFDIVTSRAVAELKIILEISSIYCKINGMIIVPKSNNYSIELSNAKNIVTILKLNNYKINTFDMQNYHHNVFVFKKTTATPNGYPRTWKEIIK